MLSYQGTLRVRSLIVNATCTIAGNSATVRLLDDELGPYRGHRSMSTGRRTPEPSTRSIPKSIPVHICGGPGRTGARSAICVGIGREGRRPTLTGPAVAVGSVSGRHDVVVRPRMWSLLVAASVALWCAACSSRPSSASSHTTETTSAAATTPSSVPVSPEVRAALERIHVVTALGDSVPYGTACDCTPYPQLSGADIAPIAAHAVEVSNDAVPGSQSGNLVDQVQRDPRS